MIRYLTSADVVLIAERIQTRQQRFKDEPFVMSVGVVLMNHGDRAVQVECIGHEWSGVKGDLTPRADAIPLCPNNHPLIEITRAPKMALVDDEVK